MNYEQKNQLQTWSEIDPFTEERYRQFTKHMKERAGVILDIGCNTGRGGATIKSAIPGSFIYGLDVVESRVNQIPEGVYEDIMHLSLMEIGHDYDNFFDYVVAGEVIEHIAPAEVDSFIETIFRILKPGGLALITTPNPDSLLVKLGKSDVYNDPSHLSIMSIKTLKGKMAQAGYKNVQVLGSGKASRYVPENFPLMFPFGSYLVKGRK